LENISQLLVLKNSKLNTMDLEKLFEFIYSNRNESDYDTHLELPLDAESKLPMLFEDIYGM
jgi:hypothetical protein